MLRPLVLLVEELRAALCEFVPPKWSAAVHRRLRIPETPESRQIYADLLAQAEKDADEEFARLMDKRRAQFGQAMGRRSSHPTGVEPYLDPNSKEAQRLRADLIARHREEAGETFARIMSRYAHTTSAESFFDPKPGRPFSYRAGTTKTGAPVYRTADPRDILRYSKDEIGVWDPEESQKAELQQGYENFTILLRLPEAHESLAWGQWYGHAHKLILDISRRYYDRNPYNPEVKVTPEIVAALNGALSPRQPPQNNLADVEGLLSGEADVTFGATSVNVEKAREILRTGDLNLMHAQGIWFSHEKTPTYARNLLDPEGYAHEPVIDTHMLRAFYGSLEEEDPRIEFDPKRTAVIAKVLKRVAKENGVTPQMAQAIIWTIWRKVGPAETGYVDWRRTRTTGRRLGAQTTFAHVAHPEIRDPSYRAPTGADPDYRWEGREDASTPGALTEELRRLVARRG